MLTTVEATQSIRRAEEGGRRLVRRFTLDEFAAVAEALPEDRLELIHGEIVMVPPPDKIHIKRTSRILELFAHHVREIAALGCQIGGSNCYFAVPGELQQRWVDEGVAGPSDVCPDATIFYRDYLDGEEERRPPALLVVEVLSTSKREHIERDLLTKAEIYATLAIPIYWVIDRRDQSVWAHTQPQGGVYALREQSKGDRVLPAPGLEFLALTPAQIFEG